MPNEQFTKLKELIRRSLEDPKLTRFSHVKLRLEDNNEEITIEYKKFGGDEEEDEY